MSKLFIKKMQRHLRDGSDCLITLSQEISIVARRGGGKIKLPEGTYAISERPEHHGIVIIQGMYGNGRLRSLTDEQWEREGFHMIEDEKLGLLEV